MWSVERLRSENDFPRDKEKGSTLSSRRFLCASRVIQGNGG